MNRFVTTVATLSLATAMAGGASAKVTFNPFSITRAADQALVSASDQCVVSAQTVQFHHSVVSPRDAQTGLATGKRMHKPLVVTKELDRGVADVDQDGQLDVAAKVRTCNAYGAALAHLDDESPKESLDLYRAVEAGDSSTVARILQARGAPADAVYVVKTKTKSNQSNDRCVQGDCVAADPSSARFTISITIKLSRPPEVSISFS